MPAVPLACPKDHSTLHTESKHALVCDSGHRYPVVDGIPVLLRDDVEQNFDAAKASMARARNEAGVVDARNPDLYLESLSITEEQKAIAVELARDPKGPVDPVVSVIIAATNGALYNHLVGKLQAYPIPGIRLPQGNGRTLLDVGCNWGRWSIAAGKKGYRVIGIDPQLGAVMAARRVAAQFGLDNQYVVAEGRNLPFADGSFDTVYSNGVIQHMSKQDAIRTFDEMKRVLRPSGTFLVQMAQAVAVRSLYRLLLRGFREGRGFEVRYWTVPELRRVFREHVGEPKIAVDCYFGLGIQASDRELMPARLAWIVSASEALRRASEVFPPLTYLADSVYIAAERAPERL